MPISSGDEKKANALPKKKIVGRAFAENFYKNRKLNNKNKEFL